MQSGLDECVLLTETVKQGNMLTQAGWKYICLPQSDSVTHGSGAKWLGQIDRRVELTPLWLVLL